MRTSWIVVLVLLVAPTANAQMGTGMTTTPVPPSMTVQDAMTDVGLSLAQGLIGTDEAISVTSALMAPDGAPIWWWNYNPFSKTGWYTYIPGDPGQAPIIIAIPWADLIAPVFLNTPGYYVWSNGFWVFIPVFPGGLGMPMPVPTL